MASIIEMPELVMEKIIGVSDFKAVIAFELVESKKSPNLILYSKAQRSFHGKTEFFGYRNIVNVAVRDLELVLKFQKSILERLYLEFDNVQLYGGSLVHTVPIKLSNMFEKLNRNVKTRTLSIKTNDPSQIMRILKFVDPGTLKIIELSTLDDQMEIEIDEFVKTEQWKKAEGMHCGFDVLNLNVKDICHFSSCSIRTSSITAQELGLLKKTFSSSSKLEYCRLELRTFNEEMSNLWGPANLFGSRSTWYFQMENSDDKILRIETDQIPQEHLPQKIVKFDMVDIST